MPFSAPEQESQSTPHPVELLDGGTGEECFRLGVPDDRTIWSARALVEERYHEIVRQVHRNFIIAGSQYITTNNYSVTPGVGLSARLEELTMVAAKLAVQARLECEQLGYRGIRICGSLPPLVESYRPDLVLPHEQAVTQYLRIVRSLNDSVDIFLAETLSSIAEAISAVQAVTESASRKPIWVSWTLRSDGRLRSGERVSEAIYRLMGENISAILFNCSEPEAICRALTEINETTDVLEKNSRGQGSARRVCESPDARTARLCHGGHIGAPGDAQRCERSALYGVRAAMGRFRRGIDRRVLRYRP